MDWFLDDGDVRLAHGDVLTVLRELPAGIAQTCVTSPPYWGLRDYGTGMWTGGDTDCDHRTGAARKDGDTLRRIDAANGRRPAAEAYPTDDGGAIQYRDVCARCGARRVDSQLGLEATPDLYVERLVGVFREVWRVLRDDGTVWLNLGDSYATHRNDSDWLGGQGGARKGISGARIPDGLKPKDLVGIPWRVAFALQADGWYLRSDIIWSKANPMPESVTDRPTKSHEYLFLLAKQPRYFYDADAIREPLGEHAQRLADIGYRHPNSHKTAPDRNDGQPGGINNNDRTYGEKLNAAGRNRRSVWTIPTEPFPEAHFATYPQALVRPCILAGTSERGECSVCGAPWVRMTGRRCGECGELIPTQAKECPTCGDRNREWRDGRVVNGQRRADDFSQPGARVPWRKAGGFENSTETGGWQPSCSCDAPTRPQTCIDPFVGSGTTALVARNHGRRAIGIDLSSEYLQIAAKRLQQLSLLGGIA